jgi:DNA polymerase III alpha subunit (gram-positive type)
MSASVDDRLKEKNIIAAAVFTERAAPAILVRREGRIDVTPFVHLHCHSDYSLLDGASSIDALVARAKTMEMPWLALTDHGNMFGALAFYKECRARGVRPILGSEVYTAPGSRLEKSGS